MRVILYRQTLAPETGMRKFVVQAIDDCGRPVAESPLMDRQTTEAEVHDFIAASKADGWTVEEFVFPRL